MEILIFGPNKPEIGFWFNPTGEFGGLKIHDKNNFVLNFEGRAETITWRTLMARTNPPIVGTGTREVFDVEFFDFLIDSVNHWDDAWRRLKDRLLQMPQTKGEKAFLSAYLDLCEKRSGDQEPRPAREIADMPAIIPQAWLYWTPYDPRDKERARKAKERPFRVDFVMFCRNSRFVIEIDGASHFAEIMDIDPSSGRIHTEPSLTKYTEHLKKDRWLRRHGWDVWRFSDEEVLAEDQSIRRILREIGCWDLTN